MALVQAEESDDDSVFINENKSKKTKKKLLEHSTFSKPSASPIAFNASSAVLSNVNASMADISVDTQKQVSRDSNLENEIAVR